MTAAATALLALWNDVSPGLEAQYNDWHAVEHVPERLTVPGIVWGRRYGLVTGTSPRYLTLYGLADASVLDGEAYRRLLREPTPASRAMRPALVNVSRWVCRLHRHDDGMDGGGLLAVRTVAGPADASRLLAEPPLDAPGATGRLLAERLRDASPLPWLGGAQGGGVEGDWLLAAALDADAAPTVGADLYRRLPVG